MIQIGASPATIDAPIEHLMACHRRIEQRLETLVKAASHLETDRTSALAAIAHSLHFLDSSGGLHTEDEENSLFPRLRKKLSSDRIAYLDSLEAQHSEAESILYRLKELVSAARRQDPIPGDLIEHYRNAAEALSSLYGAHIRSEDEVLVALARQFLDSPDLSEITREMRERRAEPIAPTVRRRPAS